MLITDDHHEIIVVSVLVSLAVLGLAMFNRHLKKVAVERRRLIAAGLFKNPQPGQSVGLWEGEVGAMELGPGYVAVYPNTVIFGGLGVIAYPKAKFYPLTYIPHYPLRGVQPPVIVTVSIRPTEDAVRTFSERSPYAKKDPYAQWFECTKHGAIVNPYLLRPQRHTEEWLLTCITEEFRKHSMPNLKPLEDYFGIEIAVRPA